MAGVDAYRPTDERREPQERKAERQTRERSHDRHAELGPPRRRLVLHLRHTPEHEQRDAADLHAVDAADGMIASDILGTPRMLFAFARDGLLPRSLGRVHPQTHTPYVAILSYAALAMILALTGSFAELAVLSALAAAGLYVAGCIAAWLLARRGVALAGVPLNFRWIGAAAGIGVSSMLLLIALGSRTEITGLVALIGASALVYLLQTRVVVASNPT